MLVIERGLGKHLPDESRFTWHSYDPSDEKPEYDPVDTVTVHPWDRGEDQKYVYVKVQAGVEEALDCGNFEAAIVDRAEFVAGLLAVFPELQRVEGKDG